MIFVGRTALSVEINTKLSTSLFTEALIQERVPKILHLKPAIAFFSTIGTCLYAAA